MRVGCIYLPLINKGENSVGNEKTKDLLSCRRVKNNDLKCGSRLELFAQAIPTK